MKFVKYLAWFIVALFIIVPSAVFALIATTTGSAWIIHQAVKFAGYELSYDAIEGNLIGRLALENTRLITNGLRVDAGQLIVSWQPTELLNERLVFKQLSSKNVTIWLHSQQQQPEVTNEFNLPDILMPFELRIENLKTTKTVLHQNDEALDLPDIDGALNWSNDRLAIKELSINYQTITATFNGKIITSKDYLTELESHWLVADPVPQSDIKNISGRSRIIGDINQLSVTSSFNVDSSSNQQRINVRLKDLIGNPTWLAEVELREFAIAPLVGAVVATDSPWHGWLYPTVASVSATIDEQQIIVSQFAAKNIGDNSSRVVLDGSISHYLTLASDPGLASFSLNFHTENLPVSDQLIDQNLIFDVLDIRANGTLANFNHSINGEASATAADTIVFQATGDGSLERLSFSKADIRSDLINAVFDANIDWHQGLDAELSVHELRALLPALANYDDPLIRAKGQLSYSNDRLTAQRFEIDWGQNKLQLSGNMTKEQPLLVNLELPDLESLRLSDYLHGDARAEFAVSGVMDQVIDIRLDSFSLSHPNFGAWQNKGNGTLTIPIENPRAFAATNICLLANSRRDSAELCAESQSENDQQTTELRGRNLPLSLINQFRDETVAERIWGLANLNAKLVYNLNSLELIHTDGMVRSERTILFALDEEVSTRFNYWQVDWRGNPSSLETSVTAELEENQGLLLGDLTIGDPFERGTFDGEIIMDIKDLTILQWILPDLRYENATALGLITIEGDKTQPEITGSLELAAQEIGFAQTGLVLKDVRLTAFDTIDRPNSITLDGQAQSGDGWVSIKGDVQPLESTLGLSIKGENFRAVQLPSVTIDVSPDISIKVANERIDITGQVDVPTAIIDQPELAESLITPSSDVEIYENGERVNPAQTTIFPLYADIRVTLGDNVKVSAFGFDGELNGALRVAENPNRALTASGSISVAKGSYEIYGQRLEIDRGTLIYNGGPINNPGLDLRVSRAQENITSTESVSVGAQVNGTIQEPEFRLYSTPTMPDSEILSYLILGRGSGATTGGNENLQLQALLLLGSKGTDMLGESLQDTFGFDEFGIDSTMNPNDTSFYVGKYLSPRLYVKYGVGLFESTNTFLVRYLLSDRFIIETTASGEAQGGDIFYTIEK